ncbi:hypothetical protein G7074_15830 [Pedobacter sp. HDW13]|uniref:hypothetical protein n=1 Tax=Pedobacter sp. HDW13 TaxID=2714940 RepID=UPI00140D14BD|nr:hypothetical protein [Pedobacter sp. HDW13]QIL40606.1 hypothetical protein G7074_15830 [Pedobacter sp. HDW13]
MKKYLLIMLVAMALSATGQQTPTNKTRSNSDYSQVDNYLIGLKRLGIPTSVTDNLDAGGLPQNTVKIIYNTTLGRLRIYNPLTATWSDATQVDLSGYIQTNPSSAQLGSIVLNGDIALTNAHSMALYTGNDQTETGERAVWTNQYLKMINPLNSTFFDVTEGYLKHSGALEIKGQTDLYGHLWINQMDENTTGNDFDIAVRNRTNGNLDKVSFNNFPFLPLTGGNIKGHVSIGQGEATTGFISDPNGYTGFAFGVPNFTSLQMRYQPNALGRGLQIYDPYDPTNVMEGNAEWKKVLVEGDAIEASSGIPQNANININGNLRVNGVYLGADKLDLNNTGYIDNVTSIFVRGKQVKYLPLIWGRIALMLFRGILGMPISM